MHYNGICLWWQSTRVFCSKPALWGLWLLSPPQQNEIHQKFNNVQEFDCFPQLWSLSFKIAEFCQENKNLICTVMVLESWPNYFGPCKNPVPLHLYHCVELHVSTDLFCHKIHLMLLVITSLCFWKLYYSLQKLTKKYVYTQILPIWNIRKKKTQNNFIISTYIQHTQHETRTAL